MREINYNPDVLTCLANLSNDEVFTPPTIVNQMLNTLPKDLWKNSKTKFLDPFTKSGVFLREIVKRLNAGLEKEIPDLQERINHILKNQVYGIAITELTALLTRRSLYCSKYANGEKSITNIFENENGNIAYKRIEHTWENGKCKYCGASEHIYDRGEELESHAYLFIHNKNPFKDMQFDVIIGNPPYQLNDGGGTGDSAKPIYNLFIQQAIKLKPRYLCMIIPSRWMKGGKGLDSFRSDMINDKRISFMYDYENAKECFNSLDIDGGVCYFLWDSNYNDKVNYYYKPKDLNEIYSKRYLKSNFTDTVIRDIRQSSIIEKVFKHNEEKFSNIVSSRNPYGLSADFFNNPEKYTDIHFDNKKFTNSYKIFGVKGKKGGAKRVEGYISTESLIKNIDSAKKYKLFFSKAYMTTSTLPPDIIFGERMNICTETFLEIGAFERKYEAENCLSYIKTKFFRALLFYMRSSLNISQKTFGLIPLQDFNEEWTDEKLYKKYGLSKEEIDFIESMIRPME